MKKNFYFSLIVFFLIGCSFCGWAQTITTVAGNGATGYTGDGGPATDATFGNPIGLLAVDGSGNIYVTDIPNTVVRKVSAATHIITTFAGTGVSGHSGDGGQATAAEFVEPYGIAADKAGDVFITDPGVPGDEVRVVDKAGIINVFAGDSIGGYSGDGGPATAAGLEAPVGLTTDSAGNLYVCEMYNLRIIKTTDTIYTVAGIDTSGYSGDGGPATIAELSGPADVAVDREGNVYIADAGNNRVRKVDAAGIITTFAGNGTLGYSGDGIAATAAELSYPDGVAVDGVGNVYIADWTNNRIRKVDRAGIITTIAGTGAAGYSGDGGPATLAAISYPRGITFDCAGNLYFTDLGNNRVRMISAVNHAPVFATGRRLNLTVCGNSALGDIDTLLGVTDIDTGQTENWSALVAPLHGTVAASCTATNNGGVVLPTSLSYTPATGYTGTDSFTVVVTDCGGLSDTAVVVVTINPLPYSGSINGADSLCFGSTVTLSDTVAGGVWSSSNAHARVSGGVVSGISAGVDTIVYTITASGCSTAATRVVYVADCTLEASPRPSPHRGGEREVLRVWPNPNAGAFMLHISSVSDEAAEVVIMNMMGQRVKEFITATNRNIDVQLAVPAGVYFISVTTAEGVVSGKVVVGR